MPLIEVILALVVIGIIMYLVNLHVPMAANIKSVLNWVVVIVVIIWILNLFGLWSYLGVIRVPTLSR